MQVVNILSALLTPIIAVLAVYIAYQQYQINKKVSERQNFLNLKKLNLDLYQKRFRIFNETKEILLKINKEAKIDIIEIRNFNFSINESKFLFGDEIIQYLQDLQKSANKLSNLTKSSDNSSLYRDGHQARKQLVDERHVLINWFTTEYENVENRFIKYLDFKNL